MAGQLTRRAAAHPSSAVAIANWAQHSHTTAASRSITTWLDRSPALIAGQLSSGLPMVLASPTGMPISSTASSDAASTARAVLRMSAASFHPVAVQRDGRAGRAAAYLRDPECGQQLGAAVHRGVHGHPPAGRGDHAAGDPGLGQVAVAAAIASGVFAVIIAGDAAASSRARARRRRPGRPAGPRRGDLLRGQRGPDVDQHPPNLMITAAPTMTATTLR
jgi:hypothetical protein